MLGSKGESSNIFGSVLVDDENIVFAAASCTGVTWGSMIISFLKKRKIIHSSLKYS